MQIDLIFIGNELLTGLVNNTNAGYLSRRLWSAGIAVRYHCVIKDDEAVIKAAVSEAMQHSDVIICCGGMGPTDDDLTREAVAGLLGKRLLLHPGLLKNLEQLFLKRGYTMPPSNRKQALLIEGSTLVDNRYGTAPGALIEQGNRLIVLLPGPPGEMQPMFEESVLPLLEKKKQGKIYMVRTIKCAGLGESLLEEKIKQLSCYEQISVSLAARGLEVQLQLKTCNYPDQAAALLNDSASQLSAALEGYVYGEEEDTLAGVVAGLFVQNRLTLAVAESCSGGLLADSVTDNPGSSRFFKGGIVTYNLQSKHLLPGLTEELLQRNGAVSAGTAKAMAAGVKKLFGADVGAAITGIAGPDSDGSGLPVGLIYIAAAYAGVIECREFKFTAARRTVKERTVQAALTMLWQAFSRGNLTGVSKPEQ